MMTAYFLWAAVGFVSGSVLYCWILPKALVHKDICQLSDDHNPGAFNVFSCCGIPLGTVCVLLDLAKGCVPVYLACRQLDWNSMLFSLVLVAPVLGHGFSPMRRFRGGKCIATGFGVMIAMLPVTLTGFILAGIYIVFSTVIKIQPNRLRSILAYILFALTATPVLLLNGMQAIALGYLAIDVVAIVKHLMDHSGSEQSPRTA